MQIELGDLIVAIITMNKDAVGTGGTAPVFYVGNNEHLGELSEKISKILDGVVHDIGMGTYIIVKH
ncbi:MAG: capping complex subunit for YIEGIA [Candidatus Alkaliphilus sp. MAG34]|nr:hypothetical protein [Clostridiales bacterium]